MTKILSTKNVKKIFGDFSHSEAHGGRIRIDPDWIAENLITVTIPQLAKITPTDGRIKFHTVAADQLVNAFAEIERKGLTKYLLTWNGSFVPRHICWNRSKALSRHSWGIAFDINVAWNGYGNKPAGEKEYGTVLPLVPIFESHGFVWGGRWKTPDGMHFEVGEVNPKTQFVGLNIGGVDVKDADVVIRSNNRSYGLLGPIASAIGVSDRSVLSNRDTVPVSAFLKSHGYRIKWYADRGSKGCIYAVK